MRAQAAALAYAQIEVDRYRGLRRKGAAAQVVVDNWNFQAKKSEAELASAKAQAEIAKLNLSYTEVRAPFDGQMGKHLVDPGNTVGGAGQPSTLAEIIQLDPIYVVANLSEQEVRRVRQALGNHRLSLAELHHTPVDVGSRRDRIIPIMGSFNMSRRRSIRRQARCWFAACCKIPTAGCFRVFFVRIRLPAGKVIPNALLVPNRAVQTDQGGRFLVVVGADDVLEKRYVELGETGGELRVILSGLKPNEHVVIGDLWRANPGNKITPRLTTLEKGAGGSSRP